MVPSQSSSVPFVNVSGSQRRAFSRARCVNTSPVCVNGSTTWQRAACLTWWNLQDHPLLRANKAQKEPADSDAVPRAAARSLASFPTCFQTPVRKCLSTLKATRRARSSNWRQLGHFFSHLSHVWKCEEGTLRDICEASGRTFSHLLAAGGSIKNLPQKNTARGSFLCLIKQPVYEDSRQKSTGTLSDGNLETKPPSGH